MTRHRRDKYWDPNGLGAKLVKRLRRESLLVPLVRKPLDMGRFAYAELASFVAIRCAHNLDPDELQDPSVRSKWETLALDEGEHLDRPFELGRHPYWVVYKGECIGTVGFAVRPGSLWPTIEVSSVFVRPRYRRQGWATRVLQLLKGSAFEVGFQRVSLRAEWGNQSALSFYLLQGVWVSGWKHALNLHFAKDKPRWHMELDGTNARFLLEGQTVAVAQNRGDRLGWQLALGVDKNLRWDIEATAALQLALMGWPIIRSNEGWRSQLNWGIDDCGDFENLAFRIRRFERYCRRKGWHLPAPNPSFATLLRLERVEQRGDRLDVTLSDGTQLVLPFEALDPMPTNEDPLQSVEVVGDEIVCVLRSGASGVDNIDHILRLNQSPEHLEKSLAFYREHREMLRAAAQRRQQEV